MRKDRNTDVGTLARIRRKSRYDLGVSAANLARSIAEAAAVAGLVPLGTIALELEREATAVILANSEHAEKGDKS